MGRFLDEPQKTYKGKFLDDVTPKRTEEKTSRFGDLAKSFALGGAPGYSMTPGSEDILPMAGQTVGGTFGGFGGSVAGATAGQAGRQGIKALRGEKADWSAIPKEAVSSASIEGLTRGFGKIAKPVANRMMMSVLRPARDVIKKNPNLGIDALEAGITGSRSGMIDKAEKIMSESESQLKPLLSGRSQKVFVPNVLKELDEIKRMYGNVNEPNALAAIKEVEDALTSKMKFGQYGMMDVGEANQLKRDLYKVLKDSQYGKGIGEIPAKAEARKYMAHGLMKEIEGAIPEVAPINKRTAMAMKVNEALGNSMANQQRTVLLPKLAGMGAGAVALSGNIPGALGILAGEGATDFLRSPYFISGTAKNLMRAKKFGRPMTLAASEGTRRLFGGD